MVILVVVGPFPLPGMMVVGPTLPSTHKRRRYSRGQSFLAPPHVGIMAVLLATSNGSGQALFTAMTRQLRCVDRVMCKGEGRGVKHKGILLSRERGKGERERKRGEREERERERRGEE